MGSEWGKGNGRRDDRGRATNGGDLTSRELEVLTHVAAGMTLSLIAETMCLSVRTIEEHLDNGLGQVRSATLLT